MRYSVLTYLVMVGILMISGCSGVINQETAGQAPVSGTEMNYRDVMEAWTQEGRIYDGLLTKLLSKVTFKSDVFREAYVEEYARIYSVAGAEHDKLLLDERKEAAAYHDFVIAAYVPEKKWDDFSKETSMWKIYLTRDNVEQIRPLKISKLKRNDPIIDHFYPYMTVWKSIYQVRFPAFDPKADSQLMGDPTDALTLIMTSVIGSVEFKWEYNRKQ